MTARQKQLLLAIKAVIYEEGYKTADEAKKDVKIAQIIELL